MYIFVLFLGTAYSWEVKRVSELWLLIVSERIGFVPALGMKTSLCEEPDSGDHSTSKGKLLGAETPTSGPGREKLSLNCLTDIQTFVLAASAPLFSVSLM